MAEREPGLEHADLLVELGCEELPPGSLARLAEAFYAGTCSGLEEAGLGFDATAGTVFYTPRRLSFIIPSVPGRQVDQVQDRRGPAVGAAFDAEGNPTPAATGFAQSVGLRVDQLQRLKTDKGEWLFCHLEKPGMPLAEVLYPVLQKALADLPVNRPMRWADHAFGFVRPVHWLMVLHGNQVLDGELYGQRAGNATRGHRIHAPGPHEVRSAGEYDRVLEEARVLVSPVARKRKIRDIAARAGEAMGGRTRITEKLLEEVNNIVEWPVAVTCRFEDTFLEVPEEALVASMEEHQRFFPVTSAEDGSLTSGFVVIANLESADVAAVRAGYERVIRPRLADARFFWEQDLQISLDSRTRGLDDVVFQEKLGSVGDKSRRISTIASKLAEISGENPELASRAAELCKADLLTQMVGEFPGLQGTMGAHYARASGEEEPVCAAIGSHYMPRFSGDGIPPDPIGRLVSLADRMDTLVGIFAAGLKPTGNRDPFALRRAALGSVRIMCEAGLQLPLDVLLDATRSALEPTLDITGECLDEARSFLLDRFRQYFLEQDFSTSVVNAVFAAPVTTLPDLHARLLALAEFDQQPVAERLIAANKRIGNILRKSGLDVSTNIDTNLLQLTEERSLFEEISNTEDSLLPLFERSEYAQALAVLANLDGSIAGFFDHVMVMDEDPAMRDNRLALLARLKGLFDRVADLSQAAS